MRICLYTETALPKIGGQEMVVDALARRFQALGHDTTVLAPMPRQRLCLADDAFPYPVVRHPRFYSRRFFVGWYRRYLRRLHRRQPFDVVHCHGTYPPGYLAVLLRDELACPVVITSHGADLFGNSARLAKPVIIRRSRQALEGADALVAISRFTRDGFARFCPSCENNIVDVPNGVDLLPFAESAARPPELDDRIVPGRYVLFLGRLHRRKGVDILLESLESLERLAGSDQVQLVVAGDGHERASLEEQCARRGLVQRVRFVGATGHPAKAYLLQNARCTVVPSRTSEAFGLVVLESFAAGTPVIATDTPGLGDLVTRGQTGWLVPREDPRALGAVLSYVLTHDVAAVMRERCREIAQRHSWEAIALRHLALYQELRQGKRPAPAPTVTEKSGLHRTDRSATYASV
jgi:glycosyltransferase involved in cell wall biosynthesis